MVEINVTYAGDLHCESVHGPSSARLETDAPVDNQGRGAAFSPTDLCATALATCMLTVMGIEARDRGIALEGTTCRIKKIMTAEPPRRIARLEAHVELAAALSDEDRRALEQRALHCPVMLSLLPDIEKDVVFNGPENAG